MSRLLLSWLLLALAPTPASAQDRIEGDSYRNARYGIEITKPAGWHFITAATVLDLADKAAGVTRQRGAEDPVRAAGFAVVVSKVPSLGRSIAPQVIVLVQELREPSPPLVPTCEAFRSGMTEPETLRPTRELRLGERPAARLEFQGLVDGAMVRATALCAIRERLIYAVVGQALAAEFDGASAAFESVIGSFRLR